jgi:hypothetical protein
LLRDTASLILKESQRTWKNRVEATLQWEKGNEELADAKQLAKRTVWARGAEVTRKARVMGEPALKKKRLKDTRKDGVQTAQQRERHRIEQDNAKRYEDGQAPMSKTRAERRVRAAGEQALRDLARKNKMVEAQQLAAGSNIAGRIDAGQSRRLDSASRFVVSPAACRPR